MKFKERYLSYKKKYWYLFPGLVIAFFIKERKEERFYFSRLSSVERKEINRMKWRYSLSVSISLILHIILFIGIYNGFFMSKEDEKVVDIGEGVVDFELVEGMISSELSPVYDSESNIAIDPSLLERKKKKDKRKQSLETLLQELKSGKNPLLSSSVSVSAVPETGTSGLEQEERKFKAGLDFKAGKRKRRRVTPLKTQLWNRMNLSKSAGKSKNVNVNYTDVMKVIDKHSFYFRNCYEQALLKDEKLSVKVIFFLKLNQSKVQNTRLEMNGKGNTKSRRALSHCLFRKSKDLVFLKNKENISVKFNLIFGL